MLEYTVAGGRGAGGPVGRNCLEIAGRGDLDFRPQGGGQLETGGKGSGQASQCRGECPSETQSFNSIWGVLWVAGEPCLAESGSLGVPLFAGLQGLHPLPGGPDFSVLEQGFTLD